MNEERLTSLERRLQQVEAELARTQRELQAYRSAGSRKTALTAVMGIVAAGLLTLLTTGNSGASPAQVGSTVKAPFTVVSSNGATIFQVDATSLRYTSPNWGSVFMQRTSDDGTGLFVTNTNGTTVAGIGDSPSLGGGSVQVFPSSGLGSGTGGVAMRATGSGGSLTVYGSGAKAAISPVPESPMALQFFSGSKEALGIGVGSNNSGLLTVRDSSGHPVASLSTYSGGGLLQIYSKAGSVAADVGTGAAGAGQVDVFAIGGQSEVQLAAHPQGGYLAIAKPGGSVVVEGGVLPSGIGIVRAYGPGGFNLVEGRDSSNSGGGGSGGSSGGDSGGN